MNKYEQIPEYILDLHGYTTSEAKLALEELIKDSDYRHVRVITGKGQFRETGPVLRTFVCNYLSDLNIKWNISKLQNGGEGSLEVFLKK